MDKYLAADKKLAKLLGYGEQKGTWNGEPSYWTPKGWKTGNWTKDNAASFSLIVEHLCQPDTTNADDEFGCVSVQWAGNRHKRFVEYVEHHGNDKELATRYAIVLAVIAKLEGANEFHQK